MSLYKSHYYYRCPSCKSSTLKIFCDRVSARRIKQLQLSCKNEGMGCDWSGILEDYDCHISECGFVMVDCPNEGCMEKVPRNNLEKHHTELCQRRLVDCASCEGKVPFNDIPTHPDVCPNVEIVCGNIGCSAKFFRYELAQHKRVCKRTIIDCPFNELGCEVVILRSDLQKHLREYYEKHAVMSTQTVQSLQNELKSVRRELGSKSVPPLVFKMYDYNGLKEVFGSWDSPAFYSHPGGYSMTFSVIPDIVDHHLSLYFHLVPGHYDHELVWPFDGEVTISILNQTKDRGHFSTVIDWSRSDESVRGRPTVRENDGWGREKFISHAKLEAVSDTCSYIKDDCIYFKISSIKVRSSQKPYYWLDAQTS